MNTTHPVKSNVVIDIQLVVEIVDLPSDFRDTVDEFAYDLRCNDDYANVIETAQLDENLKLSSDYWKEEDAELKAYMEEVCSQAKAANARTILFDNNGPSL
jgi:hypothetical protein